MMLQSLPLLHQSLQSATHPAFSFYPYIASTSGQSPAAELRQEMDSTPAILRLPATPLPCFRAAGQYCDNTRL